MTRKMVCWAWMAALLTLGGGLADSALAAEGSPGVQIAPLLPRIEPDVAPEMAARFQQMLEVAVTDAGHGAISPEVVRGATERVSGQMACADADCAAKAQGQLGVRWSLSAYVQTVGKNYKIEVFAHRGGKVAGGATGRCDVCTFSEALERTREIGGQAVAQIQGLLEAAVAAPDPGRPSDQPEPGTSQPVESTSPAQVPEQASRTGRQWPLWPAIAAGSAGVLGLIIGVSLVAIDGRGTDCRGDPRPDYRNCERLYDTSGAGWALTTIGVAGLATSGVLLYLHMVSSSDKSPKRPEESSVAAPGVQMLSLWPSEKGLVVGAGGTF